MSRIIVIIVSGSSGSLLLAQMASRGGVYGFSGSGSSLGSKSGWGTGMPPSLDCL
jgi:hypothetical protein